MIPRQTRAIERIKIELLLMIAATEIARLLLDIL